MRETMTMAGPTIRRRQLGRELLRLRESSGLTAEEAGRLAKVSKSTITRLEQVKAMTSIPTIGTLLRVYGVEEPAYSALIQVALDARQRGWWRQWHDVVPDWIDMFIGLESDAVEQRGYEPALIPGQLQTAAYAEALFRTAPLTDAEVAGRVELRMARQNRPHRPRLHFILSDAVLACPVGGPEVMRAQLEHLLESARHEDVTVQVLPVSAGAHGSMGVAWTELIFAASDEEPPLVYLENYTSGLYLEEPREIELYEALFAQLAGMAMSPGESLEAIAGAVGGT